MTAVSAEGGFGHKVATSGDKLLESWTHVHVSPFGAVEEARNPPARGDPNDSRLIFFSWVS